jgi:RNA polymerase sigma-70 factor (sigma-E family)
MTAARDFESLVAEHGGRLLRLAYQLTHDRHGAEDVVQEALMQIMRRWPRLAPRVGSFEAYARKAVVNEFLRRRRLRSAAEVVTAEVPEPPLHADVDAVADRDAVWRGLAALPDRQRAVLVLRFYEDLPDRVIAELIGAKEATVRSLAARGLTYLRSSAAAGDWSPA